MRDSVECHDIREDLGYVVPEVLGKADAIEHLLGRLHARLLHLLGAGVLVRADQDERSALSTGASDLPSPVIQLQGGHDKRLEISPTILVEESSPRRNRRR